MLDRVRDFYGDRTTLVVDATTSMNALHAHSISQKCEPRASLNCITGMHDKLVRMLSGQDQPIRCFFKRQLMDVRYTGQW